jgi:hypothetical protein
VAAGRVLSDLLKRGGLREVLAEAIADLKREAHVRDLTEGEIDAQLQAWRAEREHLPREEVRRAAAKDLPARVAAVAGRIRGANDTRPVDKAEWDAASGDQT